MRICVYVGFFLLVRKTEHYGSISKFKFKAKARIITYTHRDLSARVKREKDV